MDDEVTLVLNSIRSGGAEKQLLWVATEIVASGIRCGVFELTGSERTKRIDYLVRDAEKKGVAVHSAPRRGGLPRAIARLRMHLKSRSPQIVWSWGLRADCAYLAARCGIPRAARWLTSVRSASGRSTRTAKFFQRICAHRCNGIISNTNAGLRLCSSGSLVTRWVLPNAAPVVPNQLLNLPCRCPDRPVLTMLGNIRIAPKGYDVAAQVARLLLDRRVLFEIRIAGRPDELRELQSIICRLAVGTVVKFAGEVSRPEEFLREGHLYLLLSRFEGMPNTLLEALNVGLPAIATDVGDLRVLKEQGAPFELIPTEDPVAAADAVERALKNWPKTRAKAAEGRAWVQANFSEAKCREVLRSILREVLDS